MITISIKIKKIPIKEIILYNFSSVVQYTCTVGNEAAAGHDSSSSSVHHTVGGDGCESED